MKRYIGKTDEPLCTEGIELLRQRSYPDVQRIYTSPLKRCRQTADIVYPGRKVTVIHELAECDFGLFENKNYRELAECEDYQKWIDSNGTLPFPGGESRQEFSRRSILGFEAALEECRRDRIERAAFVVHGGTIMSIMEKYAYPAGSYYDYQVGNGEGYELFITDDNISMDRFFAGSDLRRSQVVVSSGPADRASDYDSGTNYQKLFPRV